MEQQGQHSSCGRDLHVSWYYQHSRLKWVLPQPAIPPLNQIMSIECKQTESQGIQTKKFYMELWRHLSKGDILSMLKFDNILLPINNFKTSIGVNLSNVTSIKPAHTPFINLQHVTGLDGQYLHTIDQFSCFQCLITTHIEANAKHPYTVKVYLVHLTSFSWIVKVTSCHIESTYDNLSPRHWFVRSLISSFIPGNKLK